MAGWRRGCGCPWSELGGSANHPEVPVPAGQHAADAAAAGKEFVGRLRGDEVVSDVGCAPHAPLNLLAAAAMWAGLRIDPDELRKDVIVVKVRPVPEGRG